MIKSICMKSKSCRQRISFEKRIEQHMDKVYKKGSKSVCTRRSIVDFLPVSGASGRSGFCLYRLTGVSGRAVGRRIFGMREDD